MAKKFSFNDVPQGYHLCFKESCPQHLFCIRYLAGQHLPADVLCGPVVYPNAEKDGECRFFKLTRVIHGAWGFRNLYKDVEPRDAQKLKARVTNFLGGPVAAYAYMHGQRLLTPEQQESIQGFFRELGYEKERVYEGFSAIYDFTE